VRAQLKAPSFPLALYILKYASYIWSSSCLYIASQLVEGKVGKQGGAEGGGGAGGGTVR